MPQPYPLPGVDRSPGGARTSFVRRVFLASLSVVALGATCGAGAAPHGGPVRAFVALACNGRVAAVDVDTRRVVWRLRVGRGPQEVASTIDGRRVIVLSVLAVLDLGRHAVVARIGVGRNPTRLVDDLNGHLWIAHGSGGRILTLVDISMPVRPRVVGSVDEGGAVRDLAFASRDESLFLAYRRAGVAKIRLSDRRLLFRRPGIRAGRIVVAADRTVWVTNRRTGGLLVLSPRSGRLLRTVDLHGQASAVAAAGSWIGAANGDRLTLETAPSRFHVDIPLGAGCALGVAFAVS